MAKMKTIILGLSLAFLFAPIAHAAVESPKWDTLKKLQADTFQNGGVMVYSAEAVKRLSLPTACTDFAAELRQCQPFHCVDKT